MKGERRNYITSDEYFMTIAKLAGMRSKENYQIGTCIVDSENRILSIGCGEVPDAYNESGPEFPRETAGIGFEDTVDETDRARSENTVGDIRLYTSAFPSRKLANEIIQSGIRTVIYDEESSDSLSAIVSDRLLRSAGISCRRYRRTGKMIAFAV